MPRDRRIRHNYRNAGGADSASREAKNAEHEAKIVALIKKWRLAREHVPSDWLKSRRIRNLSKMTSIKLLSPMSAASVLVATRLRDQEALKKAKVRPYNLYIAVKTYQQGHGMTGTGAGGCVLPFLWGGGVLWQAAPSCIGRVGIDGRDIDELTRHMREATAVLAMATARIEPRCHFFGFCDESMPLNVTKNDRLDEVECEISDLPFGGTDCSLPILYALENKIPVYRDMVWLHTPTEALAKYHREMGIPAKMAVAAMTATEFTIADPEDVGQMDVVGFDAGAVQVMAAFVRG
ncbi:hypothetical protein M427DRAFT_30749 [Gonapodya prolifera JEL478]|uniref:TROVE domain-containing protein n=1 Tax=Gonapodya prolifera (strain JEL478) TaxID=1344416 RepID=A0A139AK79_GONPJ|nr:hypothetical protein M427DRAFT_30749 [Gonapodya prolifera JEL478]|eukprot:KXS16913.1 hypothetical protein M427DRAFT_30749 [Gonapodya prolifera JEL478]